jgi:predicted TIM-barrel fold metal-dependent hydrolase
MVGNEQVRPPAFANKEKYMYNGTKVLDVHGHVSTPAATRGYGFSLMASNTARRSPVFSGKDSISEEQYRNAAQRHVTIMDERDIDVQLIGPRPYTQMGFMAPHLIPAWTEYTNDTIAQQCQMFPDRFVGAAMLPQDSDKPDTKHVLAEMDRCVNEFGFQAVYVGPDPKGLRTTPGMHEEYWYDLYAHCEELQIPIVVHGTNCQDPRHAPVPQNYQLGFMMEQFLANQLLSHTDVFKRFPGLRVVICHCGGALDRFIKTDSHLGQEDYSNNLFYDTCAYDLIFLEAAIKQRGVNRMLFGTEAPGSGSAIRPETGRSGDYLLEEIAKFDFLTDADRVDLIYNNIVKVFPGLAKI